MAFLVNIALLLLLGVMHASLYVILDSVASLEKKVTSLPSCYNSQSAWINNLLLYEKPPPQIADFLLFLTDKRKRNNTRFLFCNKPNRLRALLLKNSIKLYVLFCFSQQQHCKNSGKKYLQPSDKYIINYSYLIVYWCLSRLLPSHQPLQTLSNNYFIQCSHMLH